MIEIRFRDVVFDGLRRHLVRANHADEEGALLLARESRTPEGLLLLVTECFPIPDSGLIHKGPGGLTVDPEFLAPVIKRARGQDASVILTHSHPFSDASVRFSSIDDAGEKVLMPKLQERIPGRAHGTIVFGRRSVSARVWLPDNNSSVQVDRVTRVGSRIEADFAQQQASRGLDASNDKFHRQILAFTKTGQNLLADVRVGIVGLGGIGSQVFQNLLYLGIRDFVLVDGDVVEASNLSRLVGATAADAEAHHAKVEVMKRLASVVDRTIRVEAIRDNVYHYPAAERLKSADVIFCCTDTMVSRMVLTRFPKQFFIPLIDVGVNIQLADGEVSRIGGRVMVLGPDDPCLDCLEYLDHSRLTRELADFGVVASTPYVSGIEDPVPAVVSYNGTLAGLAVSEFLRVVLPNFPPAPEKSFQVLDGVDGIVRRVSLATSQRCGVCDDLVGMGDSVDLPAMKKAV